MNRTTRTLLATGAAATLSLLGITTSAHAASTVECVGFAPGTAPADCTAQHPGSTLQATLQSVGADTDADIVRVAPGTFDGSYSLASTHGDRIVGSGVDATKLRFQDPVGWSTIALVGSAAAPIDVSDLTVERAGGGSGNSAVSAKGATLERVRLHTTAPAGVTAYALTSTDTTITGSTLEVGGAKAQGVFAGGGTTTVEDSTVRPLTTDASVGATVSGAATHLVLRRTTIGDTSGVGSFAFGVYADSGFASLQDSLVDLGARNNAAGVLGANYNSGANPISLSVRRSTIVGMGAGQVGVQAFSDGAPEVIDAFIDETVVSVAPGSTGVQCDRVGAGKVHAFAVQHSVLPAATSEPHLSCAATAGADVLTGAAPAASLFVAPLAHDFGPLPTGPLVDAGAADAIIAGPDAAGHARVVDGNADGVARIDVGAFEYQPPTAPVDLAVANAAGAPSGTGAGASTTSPAVRAVPLTLRALVASATFTKPAHARGAFSPAPASTRGVLKVSTSRAATLRVTLARKAGHRYVAVAGHQSIAVRAGSTGLRWQGRWNGRAQSVGTYRVTLVAVDAQGIAGAPTTVTARLVARR